MIKILSFLGKIVGLFFLSLMISSNLNAQNDFEKNPILTDRFLFNAGVFFPTKNVSISENGEIATPPDDKINLINQ